MAKVSPARGRLASRLPQFAGAFSTKGICSLPSPFARKALPTWKYLGPRHSQPASPLLAEGTPNLGDPCQSKGPAPLISGVQATVCGYLHGGYPPCSFISGHLHPAYVGCRWQYRGYPPVLLGIPEPPLWGGAGGKHARGAAHLRCTYVPRRSGWWRQRI